MGKLANEYKPAVFWSFNDVLETEELSRQLDELLKVGCSGGFLHSRVGLVTEYMSVEWMDAVRHCCQAAKEKGTELWLYDEDRFPSGYAGGTVLEENDALRTKALCLIPQGQEENYSIRKVYKTVTEAGKDYTIALCVAKDGNPNFEGKCYVDLLDPETTKSFIRHTHEKYKEAIGEYFGKEIKGIFSDEFTYTQKAAFPCFTVPYTTDLEQDFAKRYGYDLVENMEKLFFDREGYPTLRRDFYELLTNRFVESFTIPYNNWCKKNGLVFTGHLIHEDFLTTQPEWSGAVMPHYAHMEMPGIDKLGSDPKYLLTVKQLTSVTDQLGKRSLCEAFGCSGHQFGPGEMKRVADWLCVLGINFINPHLTLYSTRGERKRDYPPDFSWRQPWFEVGKNSFDHITRVCQQMDSGKVHTDVLVIHPIQSVWAEFSPVHKPNPVFSIWSPVNENAGQNYITETERFQKPFLDLSNQLLENGINYHYGDEMILRDHGRFEETLFVGQCGYKKVIVPPVSILRPHTVELLCRMVEKHGKESVVFVGGIPDCVSQDKKALFTVVPDVRTAVRAVNLSAPVVIRDAMSGQIADKVYYRVCEDVQGQKSVFVVNTSRERGFDVTVTLPYDARPSIMDTLTGELFLVPGQCTDKGFACNLHLKVGGSAMFVEGGGTYPQAGILQCGATFACKQTRVQTILTPALTASAPNVLPLNVVNYTAAGRTFTQRPVEAIWQTSFYKLPDGTPFEAEYRFSVAEVPQTPVTILIEMARNLDEVILNGVAVPVQKGNTVRYFDPCFDTVIAENLRLGSNSLLIRGKKCSNINGIGSHTRVPMGKAHPATELESVFVCGQFGVASAGNGEFEITPAPEKISANATKGLYPFYLGKLSCNFTLPQGVTTIRADADARAVELRINGESKGVSYLPPFAFSLSGEETGDAELVLYNSLENTFGPLHLSGRKDVSMIGSVYFPDMKRYEKEPVLFDYGICSVTLLWGDSLEHPY